MNGEVPFLLLSAHVITEFIFNPDKSEVHKHSDYKYTASACFKHSMMHFLINIIFMCFYWSFDTILLLLILSSIHFAIDLFKSFGIDKRPFLKYSVSYFCIVQAIHLSSIIIVSYYILKNLQGPSFAQPFFVHVKNNASQYLSSLKYDEKLIVSFCLLLIGLFGVGAFIRVLLNSIKFRRYKSAINMNIEIVCKNNDTGTQSGGFIIGVLERLFIIIVIVFNLKEVIGFVLATKSIARFKKFSDDSFVETFIIGSFLSFISAILIGIIIKNLNLFTY